MIGQPHFNLPFGCPLKHRQRATPQSERWFFLPVRILLRKAGLTRCR